MLPKQITVSLLALFLLTALPALALEPSASKPAKISSTAGKSASKPATEAVGKGSVKSAEKTTTKPTPATSSSAAKSAAVGSNAGSNSSAPAAPGSQSWTGYLVDRSCAAAIKGDNKDAMKSVKEHTKACSLEPSCCEAGFSIYSQGQWLDLDNGSSAIAKKLLKSSTRDKAHVVKVVGIIKRGEVRATSIVEVN